MPPQIKPTHSPPPTIKGIELSYQSKRYKYLIPKDSGHNYVYIDPIEGVKMDSPQAKLRLMGDTDLQLRNCKGDYQTFIKNKTKKEFDQVSISNYSRVHDGDRLVFGSPSDSSVEFTVKILYDTPSLKASNAAAKTDSGKNPKDSPIQIKKSPSDKKDDQAKKPQLRKTRSDENMLLKAPSGDKRANRKSDSNLSQKLKPQKDDGKKKTNNASLRQTLDDVKECPSNIQLGVGYNALTHAFTGHSALADLKPNRSGKELSVDVNSDVFALSSTSSVLSEDEVGFSMGARLTSDVSVRAKYDELVSMRWDVSKVFFKFIRNGKYDWQSIRTPIQYRRDVNTKHPNFSTDYGDYYVSDIQRWFGCCVIMVFHVKHLNDVDRAQTDIEAGLRDLFDVKIKSSKTLLNDERWSMYRTFSSCYGYSQEILTQSMSLSNLHDVQKFLDGINQIKPPGVTRRVKLTRYLGVDPEITIPEQTYRDLNELYKLSVQLSEKSLNPAVRMNGTLLKQIDDVVSDFHSNPLKYFDKNRHGDTKEYHLIRKDTKQRFDKAGKQADLAISRSGLIFEAQRLTKLGPQLDTPRGKQKGKIWRWRCGMTGPFKEKSKIASGATYTIAKGDFTAQCPNYTARSEVVRMALWDFTVLKRNMLWSSTTDIVFRQETDHASTHYSFEENTSQLLLGGDHQPIYIIGWTVKCEYVDGQGNTSKGTDGQSLTARLEMQFDGPNETALLDNFNIKVKSTDRIKCTVQVFFVSQRDFVIGVNR